jgi:fumarylpyruvate hydrolase
MVDYSKRGLFQTAGAAGMGMLAGCALPTSADNSAKVPFSVPITTIPIVGSSEVFPVRRIYCIGRNYPGQTIDHPYPPLTKNYHYEIELVAALSQGGKNISIERALDHVYGYAIGLDMTRRDLQRGMGDQKKPWEIGKSFDRSAPIGPIHPVARVGHFTKGAITLKVNGATKQEANLSQMIWSVAEQISKLSEAFELMPGDIIYSGTPENVGPVVRGDLMEGHIDGLPILSVRVV